MTILPGSYTTLRPAEFSVTVLDTPEELLLFRLDHGVIEDGDGNVRLRHGGRIITVPLEGLYLIQRVRNGIRVPGHGLLLTREQFEGGFIEFDEPYFEYGVKFLPRRNDVVEHGSLEAATAALEGSPILAGSGDYAIVRRLTREPGEWEIMPE
ncbi:MAG TPA: hypothetical protein VF885_12880 [Arthrobacter sp.]